MATFRDYYLNDNQYGRLIDVLNFLNVDLVGGDHMESVDEIKGLLTDQMRDHREIGDTSYADIARSLRLALNEWMEDRFEDDDLDTMETIINNTINQFLNRREDMNAVYHHAPEYDDSDD
tara:strand:- start:231 stop:590 length:360 start_codon:yes stop_codon:yes gene_type:complete